VQAMDLPLWLALLNYVSQALSFCIFVFLVWLRIKIVAKYHLSESGCTTTQLHSCPCTVPTPTPFPPPKRMQYIGLRLVCPAPH